MHIDSTQQGSDGLDVLDTYTTECSSGASLTKEIQIRTLPLGVSFVCRFDATKRSAHSADMAACVESCRPWHGHAGTPWVVG
eukprot:6143280-Amphidinium_carterae.2